MATHACLKIEFTEGDKCHNFMSRLIYHLIYSLTALIGFFEFVGCVEA